MKKIFYLFIKKIIKRIDMFLSETELIFILEKEINEDNN